MMTSDDKVGGWVKKGQNHNDVILEWSPNHFDLSKENHLVDYVLTRYKH